VVTVHESQITLVCCGLTVVSNVFDIRITKCRPVTFILCTKILHLLPQLGDSSGGGGLNSTSVVVTYIGVAAIGRQMIIRRPFAKFVD
jgi:hypothetical protein